MHGYSAPVRDMQFVLHDVLRISLAELPGHADLDRATTQAILEEAAKLAEQVLAPLNAVGDAEGCRLDNGQVRTPAGFRAAYDELRAGGWLGLDCDPEHGGQGMPYLMNTAVGEFFVSANMALNMYQGLTHGAVSAIRAHGSDAQKAFWLPPMVDGRWTGTMNLTEPHAGTDLGMLRTRAEPQEDGSFRITGQKIFISSGDHDLAENIVHLVLARAPGGAAGTRGLSLFIVPKILPAEDRSPGAPNALSVGKIERKMGIHGNATCVMDYDGATGFLLGDLHKGMRAMFTMMNEARLGVGLQGYAQAERAYQAARDHARDRLQGRAVRGPQNPDGPADPIIVHPDIRRNLMDQKSFVEGARALTLWGAHLIDRAERGNDSEAGALISLLTPVIKAFLTDRGFDMTVAAQQVWGGHGYIEENGPSQFVRDARIAMIYEGANGIQALDLVGRKLPQDGGRPVLAFFDTLRGFVEGARGDARLDADFLDPLDQATADLHAATAYLLEHGPKHPDAALAGSADVLHLMGHVCMGFMWARMARSALAALDAGAAETTFLETKLSTGRYYMVRQLPATCLHLHRLRSGAAPVMTLAPDDF